MGQRALAPGNGAQFSSSLIFGASSIQPGLLLPLCRHKPSLTIVSGEPHGERARLSAVCERSDSFKWGPHAWAWTIV
jgi:hypothetical protein